MRFALRNQEKIIAAFGNDYFHTHILGSLTQFFANATNENIAECSEIRELRTEDGELVSERQYICINDAAAPDAMQEFAVVGTMYGVLRLAYVGRIKV